MQEDPSRIPVKVRPHLELTQVEALKRKIRPSMNRELTAAKEVLDNAAELSMSR